MRRRLGEVASRRKIEPRAGRAWRQYAAEIERGLIRSGLDGAEAKFGVRRIMRPQLPGRGRRRH